MTGETALYISNRKSSMVKQFNFKGGTNTEGFYRDIRKKSVFVMSIAHLCQINLYRLINCISQHSFVYS